MFRQKCSWCNWTHDGNSKHTYTHPNYPGKVFYSKNCANSFISYYGEEPSEVPTADTPISIENENTATKESGESEKKPNHKSPRGGFFSRLFNLNVRNIRINDKYDWKGKRIK